MFATDADFYVYKYSVSFPDMHIAVVLYGQPREYVKGHAAMMEFIQKQEGCTFDFFYHSWTLDENSTYMHSPWRTIDTKSLLYSNDIFTHIHQLYNPIAYELENQSKLSFDKSLYINTLAYKNTSVVDNINNILFQMYSRTKARNLLHAYLEKMGTSVTYDFVMMMRFDIGVMPVIQFKELDRTKVYVSDCLCPRKLLADNCIIARPDVFLEWFTIYDTLHDIIDNRNLLHSVHSLGETIQLNAEHLIFAKYIYHFKNTDNIAYFYGGLM
jgi:hypothetical protein